MRVSVFVFVFENARDHLIWIQLYCFIYRRSAVCGMGGILDSPCCLSVARPPVHLQTKFLNLFEKLLSQLIPYLAFTLGSVLLIHGSHPYGVSFLTPIHTMVMLWEEFQWILPLYMKPISFQSKASVVCSVTTVVFIDFCPKKLNVFSQHIDKKQMNIWILQNKSTGIEMLIKFLC